MLERAVHQTAKAHGDGSIIFQCVQKASHGAAISQFLLAAPALIAWIVPIVLCAHAAADPQTLHIISDRPFAAGQIALAFAGWSVIFGIPLVSLSKRIGTSRAITIDADTVRVSEASWLRSRRWSQPLASYRGLEQRVRTTLSGLEHEVVLVHPDPAKNVVLAQSPRGVHTTLDELRALLRVPEVSATTAQLLPLAAAARPAVRTDAAPVGPLMHAA